MPNSQNWHATIQTTVENEDEILLHLSLASDDPGVSYIVAGREIAPTTGQRHLQCFVRCNARQSFAYVRALLPPCHIERARGSAQQGIRYCRKDGDFLEFGDVPDVDSRGRRTDWERFCDWARSQNEPPTDRELIEAFPSLFGRYAVSCRRIAAELSQRVPLRNGDLRPWQAALYARLQEDADDRSVEFFVDRDGGFGKSWFCGYLVGRLGGVQVLGPGKRDDLAHCVEVDTRIFLFNVPRGSMQFLNYGLLENLKDRMVLSPKYDSKMKILRSVPHVIVFSNEDPDMDKMSADRYIVNALS